MKTRIIQTRFWDDDVIQTLSKDARYLWVFIITNKELGMTNYIKIPDQFITFYTKIEPKDLIKAKSEIEKTRKIFFYKDWIFYPKLEIQNNYTKSPSNQEPYQKELNNVPNEIKSYFMDVLSTGTSTVDSSVDSTQNTEIRNKNTEIRKIDTTPDSSVSSGVKRFQKPTLDEIRDYCLERKNNVEGYKFFNYYESNGWKVGKNPMKDWKAAVRTWENNSYGSGKAKHSVDII